MMLEQSLITHSAPTLAGLKTGSLFCFSYSSGAELEAQLSRCRLALQDKGVRIRILRRTPDRALCMSTDRQSWLRTCKNPACRSF